MKSKTGKALFSLQQITAVATLMAAFTTHTSCGNLKLAEACANCAFDTYLNNEEMLGIYRKTVDGIRIVYSDSRAIQTFINKILPPILEELATLKHEAKNSLTNQLLTFSDKELSELLRILTDPLYAKLVRTRFAVLQEILARTTEKPRLLKAKLSVLSASVLQTGKLAALETFFDALLEPLEDATASMNTHNIVSEKRWLLDRVFAITMNVLTRVVEFLHRIERFTRNQLRVLKRCLDKWIRLIYQPFILHVNEQFTEEEMRQLDELSNHKVMQRMREVSSGDEFESMLGEATERVKRVVDRDPVLRRKATRLMEFLQECA